MKKAARDINGETKIIGIFGWPLTYTLSPVFQNAALRRLGFNAVYLPFPVEAKGFEPLFKSLKALPTFLGGNVTNPHKLAALHLVDFLTPQARAIGAVNTVFRKGRKAWVGHNTDAEGFTRALKARGVSLKGSRVLLLGAGGSARAVAYAALIAGAAELVVASRRQVQAAVLVRRFKRFGPCRALKLEGASLSSLMRDADLIVNTVPDRVFAVSAARALKAQTSRKIVCDISYATDGNPLLKQAGRGHLGMDGLGMLLEQGALSLKRWTAG